MSAAMRFNYAPRLARAPAVVVSMVLAGLAVCATESLSSSNTIWRADGYQRKTIYHSPQKPGYTSWVGAWIMPDESLMVSFHQVTGSVEGRTNPHYDYSGLRLANIFLRSTNAGTTWTRTAEDTFSGNSDRPAWGGSYCALSNGAIIRAVDGSQLPLNHVPRAIYFQRSTDWGKTWSMPELPPEPKRPLENYLGDFGDCISRVRRLSDGRLIALGVKKYDPRPKKRLIGEPVVLFSKDEGKHWEVMKIKLTSEQRGDDVWDEWDIAELPDGTFLGIFRRRDPDSEKGKPREARWQGIFRKDGDSWSLEDYRRAPFPHSGHPELLATQEGIILHLATTGAHWTSDRGKTWHALEFKGGKGLYRTHYYPRSVQTKDGQIFVFSHAGSDDYYGKVDQSIVTDTFRLSGSGTR